MILRRLRMNQDPSSSAPAPAPAPTDPASPLEYVAFDFTAMRKTNRKDLLPKLNAIGGASLVKNGVFAYSRYVFYCCTLL